MSEVWLPVPGYESIYLISDKGRVKSLRKNIVMKTSLNRQGYECLTLRKNNKNQSVRIHRLVAQVFLGNSENKPQVNHKDGNKLNNQLDNLEWCTPSENQIHAYENGLRVGANPNKNGRRQGELHPNSKLSDLDVSFVKHNAKKNGGHLSNVTLAKMFNVTKNTIGHIVNGKYWRSVS